MAGMQPTLLFYPLGGPSVYSRIEPAFDQVTQPRPRSFVLNGCPSAGKLLGKGIVLHNDRERWRSVSEDESLRGLWRVAWLA
jgi:hypothetical protein